MAMAGKITIAEVEELVAPGELDPTYIHTPGIYVHRIFKGENYEKRIEQRTVKKTPPPPPKRGTGGFRILQYIFKQ